MDYTNQANQEGDLMQFLESTANSTEGEVGIGGNGGDVGQTGNQGGRSQPGTQGMTMPTVVITPPCLHPRSAGFCARIWLFPEVG